METFNRFWVSIVYSFIFAIVMKAEILTSARQLFMRYGIKSVTMMDIAREMGMSKKTLYTYFNDKASLVHEGMLTYLDEDKMQFDSLRKQYPNAIEYFFKFCKYLNEHVRSMNPSTTMDLQKYYGKTWRLFIDYKKNYIYKSIAQNLKDGIEQGLYRDDMNIDIVAKLYISKVDVIMDQDLFPISDYTISQIHKEYVMYHFNGIISDKGRKHLKNITKKEAVA